MSAPASSANWSSSRPTLIAIVALAGLTSHFVMRLAGTTPRAAAWPLLLALVIGGAPLLVVLAGQLLRAEFGSDLLAGMAIVTAALSGEYLVAAVVILMLSGGQALEAFATRRAASVLDALARRHPSVAHRHDGSGVVDVPLDQVHPGDELVVLPHEICPVDGEVRAGTSAMDESYLSGEPFRIAKTIGSPVISGAINGDSALTIVARRRAADSRYAQIVKIVGEAEAHRPPMRRLADRLGAWYTPLALTIALGAWWLSGDRSRVLAVLVIATPCPLLLAIPVAILGAISRGAKRGIVVRDTAALERLATCRTAIFDKTGTLTLGTPTLTDVVTVGDRDRHAVLQFAASLEQFSKHPLAPAVVAAADREALPRLPVGEVHELPGAGLVGVVSGHMVRILSRHAMTVEGLTSVADAGAGLECLVAIDDRVAALLRFRDTPRFESQAFVHHLAPRHGMTRILLVSGDRASEVQYLAGLVGIQDVFAGQSPEQKVAIVQAETIRQPTLFVGDGLNDAPAMRVATVGVAIGHGQELAAEAADVVILEGALSRVDELLHIARRTRRIALQSALGGIALSLAGMGFAAVGWLPALAGAVTQEVIDAMAVLNALRTAGGSMKLTDY